MNHTAARRAPRCRHWTVLALALAAAACSEENNTIVQSPPAAGTPLPPSTRTADEGLPGLNVVIRELGGASGPNGNFQVGDRIQVTYAVQLDDGTPVPVDELDYGGILVSGPSFNYQPVIERQRDLAAGSAQNEDGSWTYALPPIPSTYLPPFNDTVSYGAVDGELQGQPLLDGTYTVGIEAYRGYEIEGESLRDAANAVRDFLFGSATALEPRQVVRMENCNQCHEELRIHGTIRRDVRGCVLCHTAGAEDRNDPSVAGGTPGTSIDFGPMIHKIHNGAHLPSVLGVSTDANGDRVYDPSSAQDYIVVGRSAHNYSDVSLPIWPNFSYPMPRDAGYSGLASSERALEDTMRRGAISCDKCHGDPDGAGPVPAPAQGRLAYEEPTRTACGSCHDDVDWSKPYKGGDGSRMPPQADNALCARCHPATGGVLGNEDVHRHPLLDQATNPGTAFNITQVYGDASGIGMPIQRGEKVLLDLTVKDGAGLPLSPSSLARIEFALVGPTDNRHVLAEGRIPPAALSGASVTGQPLPEPVYLERIGVSGGSLETFPTARSPHWDVSGAATSVWLRTTPRAAANDWLATAATRWQNFITVGDASQFANGDYIVLADLTGNEEYLRVQWADTQDNRLWFSSMHNTYDQPWLRFDHSAGTSVARIDVAPMTTFSLDKATGQVTETSEFGNGVVLASYTTDFVLPMEYPPPINDGPTIDSRWGEWSGLSLMDGTYTVGVWGERAISVTVAGETTGYNAVSMPENRDFLVGAATQLQPRAAISSPENCNQCHDDLWFHGSHRRGYETCALCHGGAGGEDWPQYASLFVTPGSVPETPGESIDFRWMLHKIHMGEEQANASSWTVLGFRGSPHTYEHVAFPAQPGGVQRCDSCHGDSPAWREPAERNHPDQTGDSLVWTVACASCHDSVTAISHIASQSLHGLAEGCVICHSDDDELGVERAHRSW